jgi:hydroxyethylthiazole kinase-like uncharacterized protein yjeF
MEWKPAQTLWFSRAALQEIDNRATRDFGIEPVVLMENAGRELAHVARQYSEATSQILILAGKGNNGGDGMVAARHLSNAGHAVVLASPWAAADLSPLAAGQLKTLRAMGVNLKEHFDAAAMAAWRDASAVHDVVVDCLFGSGLRRTMDARICELIAAVNESMRRVISCDIPSGLDCDSGQTWGACICAAHTVSYCGMKLGFHSPAALTVLGQVSIGDIGAPRELLLQLASPEPQ